MSPAKKIKDFVAAFRFAFRGGKYTAVVQVNDPLLPSGLRVTVGRDGAVVDVDNMRAMAHSITRQRLARAGLALAGEGEPGFRVKWIEGKI